jgi:hypothetical protein
VRTSDDIPLASVPDPDVLASPTPPRESRATKVVVAALGAALLFGPWAAYAAGARSDEVPGENRALASRPQWAGFKTFDQITAYTADRFPLRDLAIRDNKRLIKKVFGENPSYAGAADNQVLLGNRGWLYLQDDFDEACSPKIALQTVLDGVRRLDAMLTASGRRLVLTMPPDKSTADPQYLPKAFADRVCASEARDARWKALRALKIPGYVDVRSKVEKLEKDTGKPAFLSYDTHWTQNSEIVFAEAMADKLDPTLLAHTQNQAGQFFNETGDLQSLLNGVSPSYRFQAVYVVRDGVKVGLPVQEELGAAPGQYTISHFTSTTTGPATLFQPKTVWIGDSFTQRSLDKIAPFFRDLTRVPELTKAVLANSAADPVYDKARTRMIAQIVASKVTVLELVERTFMGTASYGSMWDNGSANHFLDDLQAALAKAPKG